MSIQIPTKIGSLKQAVNSPTHQNEINHNGFDQHRHMAHKGANATGRFSDPPSNYSLPEFMNFTLFWGLDHFSGKHKVRLTFFGPSTQVEKLPLGSLRAKSQSAGLRRGRGRGQGGEAKASLPVVETSQRTENVVENVRKGLFNILDPPKTPCFLALCRFFLGQGVFWGSRMVVVWTHCFRPFFLAYGGLVVEISLSCQQQKHVIVVQG